MTGRDRAVLAAVRGVHRWLPPAAAMTVSSLISRAGSVRVELAVAAAHGRARDGLRAHLSRP